MMLARVREVDFFISPPFSPLLPCFGTCRDPRTTWGAVGILSVRASPGGPGRESSGSICPTTHTYKGTKYFMTCCLPHTASPLNGECINLGGQRKPGTGTSMREVMIWEQKTRCFLYS